MTQGAAPRPVEIRSPSRGSSGLTEMQARIWASQRRYPDAPLANMALRSTVDGPLDPGRFTAAFDHVVRAADALRTVVEEGPDGVRTRVRTDPPAPTAVVDLPFDALDAWCAERVAVPLDATRSPYDSVLLRHGPEHWTWWLDLHHVVTDAVSSALVLDATAAAYAGSPLDLRSFAEVVSARRESLDTPKVAAARAHWAARAAAPSPSPLALYGPVGEATPTSDRHPLGLDAAARTRLDDALDGPYRTISRELGLLGLLATAVAVLVHRTDGRADLTIGVPVHHRGRGDDMVVGPLLELFPLDVHVEHDDSFAGLHRRVQRAIFDLLRRAQPGTSPSPDFQIVLNVLTARAGGIGGYPTDTTWVAAGAADPDHLLRLQAHDFAGDHLHLELDVNHAVGDDPTRRRVPGHLARILDAAVADPDAPIGSVVLPDAAERAEIGLLNDRSGAPEVTEPVDVTVRRVLRTTPERVVIEEAGPDGTPRTLTAAAFDGAAEGLARWLVARGVRPGDRVGVRLPRGIDAVIAVHGVLRAGGVFVMLDPDDPGHRHDLVVADADCALILDDLPAVDGPAAHEPDGGDVVVAEGRSLDDLAYLLYTSGSTGTPKGVPISHRGLAGYLRFALDAYVDPARPPTVALHSSLVFDLTITSLFLPLLAGGSVVVFPGPPVDALAGVAADRRIDLLKLTPSQLEIYLQLTDDATNLRTVVVGGEAFRRPLALALAAAGSDDLQIVNEYGPTEAVVGCMIHRFDGGADRGPDVPIGGSCPDSEVFVLDAHQQVAPRGSWGELYVRRPGMASGYRNLPSADRFAVVPVVGGPPLYRTGDRARIERPGVAVYGGRLDEQLKIGGVRFEPGEIEAALVEHPDVDNAIVRLWSPQARTRAVVRCVRCGVGTDVPGITVDGEGVCSACRSFDVVAPQAAAWFRTPDDLRARRDAARARRRGEHDCLHLLSGGKDSTYALYRLVEDGWDVHALTLDNGFISEEAKENVRRTVADLGISHEMVTVEGMAEIFRDSLERYSNVCNGCYKTIYTMGVARAHDLGIPVVVTGLSRGQFFETRLVPHQFEAGHFDPDAIDAAVLEARKVYHRTPDAVSAHLDTSLFDDDAIFDEIEFVDFYRYVDVDLEELYRFLEERAPWVRPSDTGRSTNCLINAAGIFVHRQERGFHNYALPYSWDVRLGHKTRDEALDELDDDLDEADVRALLEAVGYEPRTPSVLTAWYQAGRDLDPVELRRHLRDRLPEHAVPAAFVRIGELPLAASAKVDVGALPEPTRVHRAGSVHTPPTTPVATRLCELWAEVLGIEQVGIDDDFFDLGGSSLAALEMVTRACHALDVDIPDTAAFKCRTVRELEALVSSLAGTAPFAAIAGGARPGQGPAGTTAIPRTEELVLSAGQEALLYEVMADPDSPRYAITRRYEIDGDLDPDRLHAALLAVVAAHEPLHLTVAGGRRSVAPEDALEWRVLPAGTDAAAVAERQARTRFDPAHPPFVRATVVAGTPATLVLSLHHLWCDAGSFDVLWADLAAAYAGEPPAPPVVRYHDHAAWQRAQVTDEGRRFWADLLADVDGPPDLGLVRPVTPEPDGYLRRPVAVGRRGPSLLADLLVAIDLVLREHTDDPLVVGVPVTTRDHPDVDGLVGYFLNEVVLPLPAPVAVGDVERDPARDRADLAEAVEALLARALRHRTVPYAEVVGDRRRARSSEHRESDDLLGLMAVHDVERSPTLAGAVVSGETIPNGVAVTDLTFFVIEAGDRVDLAVEWSGRRYRAADVAQLLDRVAVVFEGRGRPGAVPDLEGPPLAAASSTVVHDIVARAAAAGDAIAVSQGDTRLTYRALVEGARRVSARLAAAGVAPGDLVGLVVPRRVELVTLVLGVQLARAGYVPIDPDYPAGRVAAVLGSADPAVVCATAATAHLVEGRRVLLLDELLAPGPDGDVADGDAAEARGAVPSPSPDDPAYVIHTSGSTGEPRGVLVRHRELAASTAARRQHYGTDPRGFLWTSSYGFDSSVAGLFWTLTGGGELVLPDDGRATDVTHLVERAVASGATHVLTVPSLWAAMLEHGGDRLERLEAVVVAGEACTPAVVDRHTGALPAVELWNEYGPTEATVWATVHRCTVGEDPVPIGRPVPGMAARVAGADGRPRPLGVAGELWLRGPQVTGGYLADGEATAARFVTDAEGRRWYRTGDRVVRRDDGLLEFHGRDDEQLNLRGVRIEPAEVEAALVALPAIEAAVVRAEPRVPRDLAGALDALSPSEADVVLREVRGAPRPGSALVAALAARSGAPPRLVAHVEPADGGTVDEAAVRAHLAERLPAVAVPHRIVAHDHLPRTPHGKLDRAALPFAVDPAPPVAAPAGGAVDALTERIAAVWREVLDDPTVGADTDVFDAGADSLHALRAVTTLSSTLGTEVGVATVVSARTPRALAAALAAEVAVESVFVPLRTGSGSTHPPLVVLAHYGGQGNSMLASCLPLVGRLPFEVDVIGVRRPDRDLLPEHEVTIEGLARDTFDDLRAARVPGPLWLFAASLNGLVAVELARLWQEAGGEVAYVGLADTYFPGEGDEYARVLLVRRYQKYRDHIRTGEWREVAQQLEAAARRRLRGAPLPAPSTGDDPPTAAAATVATRGDFERGMRLAGRTFSVVPADLPVVFYAASATPASRTVVGWRRVFPNLELVRVPGGHTGNRSFLRAERVGPLADDLRARLERSLGRR